MLLPSRHKILLKYHLKCHAVLCDWIGYNYACRYSDILEADFLEGVIVNAGKVNAVHVDDI